MTLLWGSVGKQRKITRTHCHWLTLWNTILYISSRTAWDRFDLSPSFWSCNIETHNWVFIVSKTQLIFLLKNFASNVPILNPDLSILNWTTPSNVTEICMFLHIFFSSFLVQKTHAYHHLKDSVPEMIKLRRLQEVNDCARQGMLGVNQSLIGQEQLILIEGVKWLSLTGKHTPKIIIWVLGGQNDFNVSSNFQSWDGSSKLLWSKLYVEGKCMLYISMCLISWSDFTRELMMFSSSSRSARDPAVIYGGGMMEVQKWLYPVVLCLVLMENPVSEMYL